MLGSMLWNEVYIMPRQVGKTKASKDAIAASRRITELAQTLKPWLTEVDVFNMSSLRGAMNNPTWLRRITLGASLEDKL